jgi:S-DNA-T family DNA segregation ATPase FtsK/SpoIIIE
MPKKKKNSRSNSHKRSSAKDRKSKSTPKVSNGFGYYAFAVGLVLLAILLAIGAFNTGGALPVTLYHGFYWTLGWAAPLVPVLLIISAVLIFRNEEAELPTSKLVSLLLSLLFFSGIGYAAFANKASDGVWTGGHGGNVGSVIGGAVLGALDKIPALLVFFILAILAVSYALGLTAKDLLKLFKRSPKAEADTDLAELKAKAESTFKLNEGVPIEHHSQGELALSEPLRNTNFRNTAQKLSKDENHAALTTPGDPDWKFPPTSLLNQKQDKADPGDVNANARTIHDTLANFNIDVQMEGANIGPRVTQYSLRPPSSTKLTKITALESNLALDLAAHSIRIEAPIPGKRAVGIEVPNVKPAIVRISSILESQEWAGLESRLGFVLGKDIAGKPVVADLNKMPHMLIAGQTGSGKSVMINSFITSLLYRNTPSDLKLIMVDPKQVELALYNDIPHLLTPVINEPEKCISALKWAVAEMERRLRTMAEVGKRDIGQYNLAKAEAGMPYIVIVIDELADLMMVAARDVEALIVRLAQKSRAAGIHLVIATQRPSVDVITGLIKANVPARIAFTVNSQVDSRTIIDQAGAEKLLGSGDMLFLTSEMPKPKRVQAALIEEEETKKVVEFIRMQRPPQYDDEVISQPVQLSGKGSVVAEMGTGNGIDDDMWHDAVHVVLENRKASTSLLQRRLRIGYGRAARLIETMEESGIVGPADGSRPREVLISSMDEVFGMEEDGAAHNPVTDSESGQDAYLNS